MAKKSGLAQQIFVGGYDLSGDVGALGSVGGARPATDVTGINSSSIERLLTHGDGQMEFNVWWNDASSQEHAALSSLPTADVIILWALGGAIADVACGVVAKQVNYDWTRGVDGSLQGTVLALADAVALEWGLMLTAGAIRHTGATNGTSRDDGGASSDGIAGYLEVTGFDGTNVTIVIQESSDNGVGDGWATIVGFAQVSGAAVSERKAVSGSVERYLRVSSTGTFTTVDFAVGYRRGDTNDDSSY